MKDIEMAFRLMNSEMKALTHELATQFRDMPGSPTERVLDQKRVKYLRERAEAGQLLPFHWATAKLGNDVFRVNGQHSSHMLCELNGHFPEGLKVHLDHYEVTDLLSLGHLFRQFDSPKSARSKLDVAGAFQGLFEGIRGINRKDAKIAMDGIGWHDKYIVGVAVPARDELYTLFSKDTYHPFLQWVGELFSIKTPELKQVSILAAMYACYGINESDATQFWSSVARGNSYEEDQPPAVLDAWLTHLKEYPGERPKNFKPVSFWNGCIFAWNAYREGRTLKDIKHNHKAPLTPV